MKCCQRAGVTALLYLVSAAAYADEAPFLQSLAGDWTGGGMMKRTIASSPINLSCSFKTQANGEALSMKGTCRGMIVITRPVSANIKVSGTQYAGSYVGPSGGVSGLHGSRRGDAINLAVRWSKVINGDRSANMTIQRVDANAIRIRTVDEDPASGQQVVTSEINLQRD
ncbi:hypothetical protein [Rhizobium sp. R693]|uniref:hypothetical protein n=1 Tax=Rhizobium sp. R693 TaxID=1764276 RepID=UPI000B52AF58|nr:hypothetical protein [Rhizobium sp. R693]OWW00247.1 hypothetical protein ATY79_01745 [Rhizobium sp. R693]